MATQTAIELETVAPIASSAGQDVTAAPRKSHNPQVEALPTELVTEDIITTVLSKTRAAIRLASEIDWVGAILASTGLATLSYAFATLSADINNIRQASNIALLVISVASIPAFIGWMHYQVKHSYTALIPNSLWRSYVFISSCVMVLFGTSVTNYIELFCSLFFQDVQGNSALGASLRILPSLIAGALTNLSTGIFVNRVPVMWAVFISSGLSTDKTSPQRSHSRVSRRFLDHVCLDIARVSGVRTYLDCAG
ncbi:uncharacterized protein F4817DRAFT_367902 [Daldinia loculata]|uniref:uncharacterized protein n=1 Tax=Daldinia loculata TaxID=103429 RepID=UPI0020C40037|nr:uncharacterized protein F4817DRAFT_367902 [Daldinia loculata]KAI1644039.1 hypothetical protein F4817DRAFT_367902 [Daldinia loculata]